MPTNPINDISRIYLEQIVESAVPGKPAERLGAVTLIPKAEQDAARERVLAKAKEMRKKKGIKEAAKPDYLDFDGDGNEEESMKKALKDKKKHKVDEANDGNLANNYPPYDKVTRGDVIAGALGKDQQGGKKKKVTKEGFSNWRNDLIEVVDKISSKDGDQKVVEKEVNNKININPNLDLGEAVDNLGGTLLEMVEIENFSGILDEMSDMEIFLLSDELIEEVVEEFFYECIDNGYDITDIENQLLESLEISSTLLNEAAVTYGHDTKIKSDRLEKVKGAVKKVGKGIAGALGYVAGAAVRGARALGSSAKKGYERGRMGSSASSSSGTSSSTTSDSGTSAKDSEDKKPGLLSRIGSKLKRGLVKAARSVSRGSRNVARKLEGGETKKASAPKAAPKKAEKPSDPWEGSATTPPKAKQKSKSKANKNTNLKSKRTSPAHQVSKKKKTDDKLDALLASVRKEEIQINEMPFQVMGSPDGKNEKNVGKPVKSRRYADARAAELEDTHKKTGGKYRSQYVENKEYIDEKTLTADEKAKKEEIFKSLKRKREDFESRYPGRGEEVMHAVSTTMAKKLA